ncbi:Ferredoxin reductase-like, C-terminal NADP-linked [Glarea lozoyensis ATCC 20868]|uniref:Ferredoxin reductase-like, C-terminal NADP-linked n=1 Tax=Glarea lozoyensis (strain ATCC 20868 / MF5171) TaxID=1116229 RepID=S3CJS2_GLAL2|nr:Ferredoxin reductase-like, C-terminal NADP-linked [Glarea lozoyensis ATCC 20868]EPE26050.1 Ferredoxin reductase-like, C-terminal NADP-linked [Glarea lozoyensis ATCC 20868]
MNTSTAVGGQPVSVEDGFHFALTRSTNFSGTELSGDEQWERRKKIVAGVFFNRRFVPTYHLVILGVVFLLSVAHWWAWSNKRRSRKRHNRRREAVYNKKIENSRSDQASPGSSFSTANPLDISPSSSSSSTTDELSRPSPKEQDNEETPLLGGSQSRTASGMIRTSLFSLRAAAMYQPRPIPALNKVLPANGASLAVLAFIGLNIFYTFYRIRLEIQDWFVLADRAGMLFAVNLPYLYVLGAKNQPLKILTGRSYESLNLFHRRLGEVLCLQALLHGVGMMVSWYLLIRPNGFGLVRFLTERLIIYGLVAFFAYELLYLTSLASFRQRWYELFLGSHIILQIVALLFLYLHHPTGRPYVLASLAVYLIDRLVYRLALKRTTLEAYATIMEDDETVKLSASIRLAPSGYCSKLFGKHIKHGWEATDHVFVTVSALAPHHRLQAHPFTILSRAPTSNEDEAQLVLLIRARDGFSADLLMRARSHRKMAIQIDGPYGSDHARSVLEHSDLAILIAGGSGIAVLWPLVHYLLDNAACEDVENASPTYLNRPKIVIVWVIHKGEHIEWLGREVLADAENRGVEIIIPRATEEVGRPDLQDIIQQIVSADAAGSHKKQSIGVVASGPDSMGRQVRNTCSGMVRKGVDIDVTVEKFGW